jgi:hypothetical protein
MPRLIATINVVSGFSVIDQRLRTTSSRVPLTRSTQVRYAYYSHG